MQWAGTRRNMLLLVVLPALVQGSQLQFRMDSWNNVNGSGSDSGTELRKLQDAAAALSWVGRLEELEASLQQDIQNWCNEMSPDMGNHLTQATASGQPKEKEKQQWKDKVKEVCKAQKESFRRIMEQDLPRLHANVVLESKKLQTRLRGASQPSQDESAEDTIEDPNKEIRQMVADNQIGSLALEGKISSQELQDIKDHAKFEPKDVEVSPQELQDIKDHAKFDPNDVDAIWSPMQDHAKFEPDDVDANGSPMTDQAEVEPNEVLATAVTSDEANWSPSSDRADPDVVAFKLVRASGRNSHRSGATKRTRWSAAHQKEKNSRDEDDARQVHRVEEDSERASVPAGASTNDEEEEDRAADGFDTTEDEAAKLKKLTEQASLHLQGPDVEPQDNSATPQQVDFLQMGMEMALNIFQPKQAQQLCKFFDKAKFNTSDSKWLKPLSRAEGDAKLATAALVEAEDTRKRFQIDIKECEGSVKTSDADIAQIKLVIDKFPGVTTEIELAEDLNSDSKKIQDDILKQNQLVLNGLQEAWQLKQQGRDSQDQRAKILSEKSVLVDKNIQLRKAVADQTAEKLKLVHNQVDSILDTCKRMRKEGMVSLLVKGVRA